MISISEEKGVEILEWVNRANFKYLYLHMYNIKSPGHAVIIKNLPSKIKLLSIKFNFIDTIDNETASFYLDIINILKLSKIKHLTLIFDNLNPWLTVDRLLNDYIKQLFIPKINELMSFINVYSLTIINKLKFRDYSYSSFYADIIKNTNLRILNLRYYSISSRQLLVFFNTLQHTKIKILHMAALSPYKDSTIFIDSFIYALSYCKSIEVFNLTIENLPFKFDKTRLEHLFQILPQTNIKSLELFLDIEPPIDDILFDHIKSGVASSKLEHLLLHFTDNFSNPISLLNLDSLKTRAVSFTPSYFHYFDNFSSNKVMKYLTHIQLTCYRTTLRQFKQFMNEIVNNRQIRSIILGFLSNILYWNVLAECLPQCTNLIEFGYIDFIGDNNCPEETLFMSTLFKSNIRHLYINAINLNNIMSKLRNTKIIKICAKSKSELDIDNEIISLDIVEALKNSQITHIILPMKEFPRNYKVIPNISAICNLKYDFDIMHKLMIVLRDNELNVKNVNRF